MDNLTAPDSGTRFRAAYALAHTYDTSSSSNEAAAVKQLLLSGLPGEQAAAGEGVLHRRWADGHVPDAMADLLFPPVIRRNPQPRRFEMRGVGNLPPLYDELRFVHKDKARQIMLRRPGFEQKDYELWLNQDDAKLQRAEAESSGAWERQRLAMLSKPGSRPPCVRDCVFEMMWLAWLGMDMREILEIRKPPTTEVDWWTATIFKLVAAAGGDGAALDTLVSDANRIVDSDSRGALLVALVNLPPNVQIHPKVRPLVAARAQDKHPEIRRYAIELLAARRELDGITGAEEAFLSNLDDGDPDVRIRAACELWDQPQRSARAKEAMQKRLEKEPDPIVREVLLLAIAR